MFIARQPIFDRTKKVIAYELLFRSSADNIYESNDADKATSQVISASFLSVGLDVLTGGKMAFINFTGNLLKQNVAHLLPQDAVAIEILETVEPDAEIIGACRELKRNGYTLVLDDFVSHPRFLPLVRMADIIKIDFLNTETQEKKEVMQRYHSLPNLKFLAEKVETQAAFDEAVKLGYSYFQGYFFSRPVVIQRKEIPASKFTHLHLLKEIRSDNLDYKKVEDLIKRDLALCFKLFKYINSAAFGLRQQVSSIRQAITLLGQRELMKWVSLNAIYYLDQSKPAELVTASVMRGCFCELIASRAGHKQIAADVFIMGLFSLIDAILDCAFEDILLELPITDEIKAALLGQAGFHRNILEIAIAYERGDWSSALAFAEKVGIAQEALADAYIGALRWTASYESSLS